MSCDKNLVPGNSPNHYVADLNVFRERGKITAITDINSTNYFIYRGTQMGFHYDLLKSFSSYTGLDIEIITSNDINASVEMLKSGRADIIASGLGEKLGRNADITLTDAVAVTGQVLIQRKPNRWSVLSEEELRKSLINDVSQLAGKTIYVQTGSTSAETIKSINENTGGRFSVVEIPYETDKIISMVARRIIDYAVCDENVASVNSMYNPIIDANTIISQPEPLSWGIRKEGSVQLAEVVNEWLQMIKGSGLYAILYANYFRNENLARIVRSDFYTLTTGKMSAWDNYIKAYSDSLNWDWRLLASLIYQESGFRHDARSFAGAYGLMQVLPSTGRYFGVDVTSSPLNNIKGGVLYLRYLQKLFEDKIPDENERLKFILAAYNAGEGNVLDAMRLAEKYGRNPMLWDDNVAYFLLKKSDPEYYNDPVVQFGYCRGAEPVAYVSEILARYSDYRNIIP